MLSLERRSWLLGVCSGELMGKKTDFQSSANLSPNRIRMAHVMTIVLICYD